MFSMISQVNLIFRLAYRLERKKSGYIKFPSLIPTILISILSQYNDSVKNEICLFSSSKAKPKFVSNNKLENTDRLSTMKEEDEIINISENIKNNQQSAVLHLGMPTIKVGSPKNVCTTAKIDQPSNEIPQITTTLSHRF